LQVIHAECGTAFFPVNLYHIDPTLGRIVWRYLSSNVAQKFAQIVIHRPLPCWYMYSTSHRATKKTNVITLPMYVTGFEGLHIFSFYAHVHHHPAPTQSIFAADKHNIVRGTCETLIFTGSVKWKS